MPVEETTLQPPGMKCTARGVWVRAEGAASLRRHCPWEGLGRLRHSLRALMPLEETPLLLPGISCTAQSALVRAGGAASLRRHCPWMVLGRLRHTPPLVGRPILRRVSAEYQSDKG